MSQNVINILEQIDSKKLEESKESFLDFVAQYEDLDDFLEHSGMTSEDLTSWLAHYGVLGMKWGVRKDRRKVMKNSRSKKHSSTNDSSDSKKPNTGPGHGKGNTLSNHPRNKKITNAELESTIKRLRMEREYLSLTAKETKPPGKFDNWLRDVAYDVSKGAVTEVGKIALAQILKVNYNKMAPEQYQIKVSEIIKAAAEKKAPETGSSTSSKPAQTQSKPKPQNGTESPKKEQSTSTPSFQSRPAQDTGDHWMEKPYSSINPQVLTISPSGPVRAIEPRKKKKK